MHGIWVRSCTLKALLGALLIALATPCFAASDEERAAARTLAQQASKAFQEERYGEAVDLFSRAQSLVHSPVHLLYIGRALAKQGELVKAHEAYVKVTRETLLGDAPKAFANAQEEAIAELEALKPRLAYLTVQVEGGGDAEPEVLLDGEPVKSALVGVPMPVNPGEHQLQAKAPGMRSPLSSIKLEEGQRETMKLTMAEFKPATPVVAEASANSDVLADSGTTSEDSSYDENLRLGSYIGFGVGVVGLGLGTVFALDFASKDDDQNKLFDACDPNCSDAQRAEITKLRDDADSAGGLAVLGFVAGGVGVAAGVTLFILSNNSGESAAKTESSVTPYFGFGSMGVTGTF